MHSKVAEWPAIGSDEPILDRGLQCVCIAQRQPAFDRGRCEDAPCFPLPLKAASRCAAVAVAATNPGPMRSSGLLCRRFEHGAHAHVYPRAGL